MKIISLDYQNNCMEYLNINDCNAVKSFNSLISLSILHNLMVQIKVLLNLYLAKFLNISAKSFFFHVYLKI